jgi:hypothetical protein
MHSAAFVFLYVVVLPSAVWVRFDSRKYVWAHGSRTAAWAIGTLLLWIVVFPCYLAKRVRAHPKSRAPAERVAEPTAPAGWYADPLGVAAHRFWSGRAWTDHTAPAERAAQ